MTNSRQRIRTTRHLRRQLAVRFRRFGLTETGVLRSVRQALKEEVLYPTRIYWVRLMKLNTDVRIKANTKDGSINGDTLYAVVKPSKDGTFYSVTTVLLRRESQIAQCDVLVDAKDFRYQIL